MFEETIQTAMRIPMQFFAEGGESLWDEDMDSAQGEGWGSGDETEENDDETDAGEAMEAEESSEEQTQQNASAVSGGTEGEKPSPETYRVKYNGKELDMPLSDLLTAAQKGMNYDHVHEELESYRKFAPVVRVVERAAAQSGMSVDQYMAALEQREQERVVQEQVAKGIPREFAERLMTLEKADRERREREQAEQEQRQKKAQYLEFARAYPGITELPQEVIVAIAAGETPKSAYMAYENRQLRQKLSAMETNQRNKGKSFGSMKGELSGEEKDAFLSGFLSS